MSGREPWFAAFDAAIDSQPILWAQAMLEDAEKVTSQEARDAILTRVGTVLVSRFGIFTDPNEYRYSPAYERDESLGVHWIPGPENSQSETDNA